MSLDHSLERTLTIQAKRETVFRFFTDTERWAKWWGAGSTVDPRPGGKMRIRYPGNVEATGEVLEVSSPERFSFTYGFTSGNPIPPGSSRVTIFLKEIAAGTQLTLKHDFSDAKVRDEHVQGWRYQLSIFSNVVSDEVNAQAAETIDKWFNMWADPDASARADSLNQIATPAVLYRDKYSALSGSEDVLAHIMASQRFMPGVRIARDGNVRHCQGTAVCSWNASKDGAPIGSGSSVFSFDSDSRIVAVTGFWS